MFPQDTSEPAQVPSKDTGDDISGLKQEAEWGWGWRLGVHPSSVGWERPPVPMAELMHKGSWASGRWREGGKNVSSRRNSVCEDPEPAQDVAGEALKGLQAEKC